ncbi:MAG: hypothetical protein RSD27_01765 [Ruthenibacterium sp.]
MYAEQEKIKKTMLFEKDLHEKIQELAAESQRDFTKQVKFMLREYIKLKERK